MRVWIIVGALLVALVTFVLLWRARGNYRDLGCRDAPDTQQCAEALNSVYLYGGVGTMCALIALLLMGRKGR